MDWTGGLLEPDLWRTKSGNVGVATRCNTVTSTDSGCRWFAGGEMHRAAYSGPLPVSVQCRWCVLCTVIG